MDQKKPTRTDLAREQLDVALQLFLDERSYVSALTLAGAAEEILGKALSLGKRASVLDEWHDQVDDMWGVPRKEYIQRVNHARNAAKHLSSTAELDIDFMPWAEAVWMLVRACDNHERLGYEKMDRMWEFEEWFHSVFLAG